MMAAAAIVVTYEEGGIQSPTCLEELVSNEIRTFSHPDGGHAALPCTLYH